MYVSNIMFEGKSVNVVYEYQPGEKATWNYPGCKEEIDIDTIEGLPSSWFDANTLGDMEETISKILNGRE